MVKYDFGVADHQEQPKKPPETEEYVCKWEGTYVNDFGEIIIICMLFRKVNEYVCKIQDINGSFLYNQYIQYFRGDTPSCIWLTLQCC